MLGQAFILLMSIADTSIALVSDKSNLLDRSWDFIKTFMQNSHLLQNLAKLRDKVDENKYNKSKQLLLNYIFRNCKHDKVAA